MSDILIDNGLRISPEGKFQYVWCLLQRPDGSQYFRTTFLQELVTLTQNPTQEQEGMLGKQWGAIRGMHNAGVNFNYTALGIFEPEYMGIVQLYGSSANGATETEAVWSAQSMMNSVRGALAGYPQSRTQIPDLEVIQWYVQFLAETQNVLAILGHPDPRTRRRGGASLLQGGLQAEQMDDLALEQNEILFRGLARLGESFVFQLNTETIDRRVSTSQLIAVAQQAGDWASRQYGAIGVSAGVGIPIIASGSHGFSASNGVSEAQSQGVSDGSSQGWGNTHTDSIAHSTGVTHTQGVAVSQSQSVGSTDSTGHSDTWSHTDSQSHTEGTSMGGGSSQSMGINLGSGTGHSQSESLGVSAEVVSGSVGFQDSSTQSLGLSMSSADSSSWGSSSSDTTGSADSVGGANSVGHADSVSAGSTVTHSSSTSVSSSTTKGQSDGISESWGRSHATSQATSEGTSRSGGESIGTGLSAGVSPSISLNRSFSTEDDVAIRATEVLRMLETQINTASQEGGFWADVLVMTRTAAGLQQAATLIPQSFHGSGTPRPVMTVVPRDANRVLLNAKTFQVWGELASGDDPFEGVFWRGTATMLTPIQIAAYTAPALLQEGTLKIISPIPDGIGFFPQMKGEVLLGHQFSPSTSILTTTPVRLDKPRLMHTMFAGNTGYGKSVCAQRMAAELALRWGMRVVVLDFGFAWRSMLNVPGLEDRVDIRQLRPDGVRPLLWNPLQINALVNPETQMKAFADIFGTVGQLGQKQQQHRLLDALRDVYEKAGVLINETSVRSNAQYGVVSKEESDAINAKAPLKDGSLVAPGTVLSVLTPQQRQVVAVERSKKVGLKDLFKHIEEERNSLDNRDQVGRGVLEGILWRLRSLTQGEAAAQFGSDSTGKDSVAIEELGRDSRNVVILEGGKFLDNFSKAFLLGWCGWNIYADMVARREQGISRGEADLFMVFEEANIIFSGLDGTNPEASSGQSVSEQYNNMFRDSRKYGAFFGVVTQSPAAIPGGIRASCNNIVTGFLTDPKDKDVVLSALARSEKGFHDEPWRKFLSDMQIGQMLGRFPYAGNRESLMPIVFQPLMLTAAVPGDDEIERKLGRIRM